METLTWQEEREFADALYQRAQHCPIDVTNDEFMQILEILLATWKRWLKQNPHASIDAWLDTLKALNNVIGYFQVVN